MKLFMKCVVVFSTCLWAMLSGWMNAATMRQSIDGNTLLTGASAIMAVLFAYVQYWYIRKNLHPIARWKFIGLSIIAGYSASFATMAITKPYWTVTESVWYIGIIGAAYYYLMMHAFKWWFNYEDRKGCNE